MRPNLKRAVLGAGVVLLTLALLVPVASAVFPRFYARPSSTPYEPQVSNAIGDTQVVTPVPPDTSGAPSSYGPSAQRSDPQEDK